ncbi:hypothetical protein N657DRAFT_658274 [Parathielavia appendiculata]|uniref:NF-X1-type domain-containing protein n=1 Tax=Parathielavia appendiculata TaxID=2587402 RepID=A0AAN6TTR8_9PEZI|nr:hypothetical protein N657DRAFT_658274 [Parathielavia appendiculata]
MDHKIEAELGPLLVICYTNHALNQFLRHLLDVGIHKIIRTGGQSRAEELGGKNLRVVNRAIAKTTVENRILGQSYSYLEECFEVAEARLKPLHDARRARLSWDSLRRFLQRHYPIIAGQFQAQDEDDLVLVGGDTGKEPVDDPDLNVAELALWAEQNINSLTHRERFEPIEEAEDSRERIHGIYDDVNRRALLQADVLGVTTTGLAQNIKMLRCLGLKIIICEEAAEVMEPHVISALMPGVEHFIQIGDHRHLRPQIQTYLNFSLETPVGCAYQLDRSQFERRAVGEPNLPPLPVAQLNLIRRVYPNLEDHDCVENLPSVVGMRDNLFWLTHNHPEDSRDDGFQVTSHSNLWEVDMAAALIRHLVFLSDRNLDTLAKEESRSKPEEEQTAAAGLRKAVEKKQLLQTIRLATVDNFQGEVAKVIIVSLVRSNNNRKVDFLRTENRINVLVSRAQHGMYLTGNTKTYRTERNAVGTSIALLCPRHPDTPLLCSELEDFTIKSPDGGCTLICDKRLEPCGHRCPARCHSRRLHDAFNCLQPCPRIRSACQHPCPKLCGQERGPCTAQVDGVKLPCNHVHDKVECHSTSLSSAIQCSRQVEKKVPGCVHTVAVPCYQDVTSKFFRCPALCTEDLNCGHQCPGTCGRCRAQDDQGKISFQHQQCNTTCGRPYGACDHRCSKPCHEGTGCAICSKRCEVECPQSRCHQECQKPCTPCIKSCTWACEHQGACSLQCAAPCNRLPCNKRCTLQLRCGHQRPSSAERSVHKTYLMKFKTYGKIDLNDTPIAVLGCGHFFTGETLDGLVGLNSVYITDKLGNYTGLQELSGELTSIPAWPDCRVPIRQFATKRCNRVVNKTVLDATSKRFLVGGREKLAELEKQVAEVEEQLSSSRESTASELLGTTAALHQLAKKLDRETGRLRKEMNAEHQQTKKLFDAVRSFQRPMLRDTFTLLSECKGTLTPSHVPGGPPDKRSARFLRQCKALIAGATEAKLPRLVIPTILSYARIAQLEGWYRKQQTKEEDTTEIARRLLVDAVAMCDSFPSGQDYHSEVDDTVRLFEGPRYETVTSQEVTAIKSAMVSGPGGIATHSAHWYKFRNDHQFAIGECGMQLARCLECGETIGGLDPEAMDRTQRELQMEMA